MRSSDPIPATIGEMSAAIGVDVRELIIEGYSLNQIRQVLIGQITTKELWQQIPEDPPMIVPTRLTDRHDQQRKFRHS